MIYNNNNNNIAGCVDNSKAADWGQRPVTNSLTDKLTNKAFSMNKRKAAEQEKKISKALKSNF